MLFYLDNFQSVRPDLDANNKNRKVKRGLNENYGRELMELHTLGVNGGYTQHDVTEVAKVFTGWTVGKPRGQDAEAQAEFDVSKHEPGDKFVLGQKIKFDGQKEGLAVLLGMYEGYSLHEMLTFFGFNPKGFGVPLVGVYVMWILVIALLNPFCRWVAGVKARRKDWWLSYL